MILRKIAVFTIIGGLGLAGCSSGTSDKTSSPTVTIVKVGKARQLYDKFIKKYSGELKDLKEAFPSAPGDDPWQDEITSACGPPQDDSSNAFALVLLTPIAAKYGHSAIDLIKDGKTVDQAVRDEGLCK